MAVEFVREITTYSDGWLLNEGQTAALVRKGEDYFVVSTVPPEPERGYPEQETAVFLSDEDGYFGGNEWAGITGAFDRDEAIRLLDAGETVGEEPSL